MTKDEAVEIIVSVVMIEREEEWDGGEPQWPTMRALDRIKDIAIKELARLEEDKKDDKI